MKLVYFVGVHKRSDLPFDIPAFSERHCEYRHCSSGIDDTEKGGCPCSCTAGNWEQVTCGCHGEITCGEPVLGWNAKCSGMPTVKREKVHDLAPSPFPPIPRGSGATDEGKDASPPTCHHILPKIPLPVLWKYLSLIHI